MLALAAAFLVAACNQGGGDQDQGTAPAGAAPSDADVTFTQNMIPHHQQAIEMAKLVDTQTDRPELRELADSIKSSQRQEIIQMEGWLGAGASLPRHRKGTAATVTGRCQE